MLPVVWLPEADADLLEARAWYDRISTDLGERFALAVEATIEAIALHPLQFPVGQARAHPSLEYTSGFQIAERRSAPTAL